MIGLDTNVLVRLMVEDDPAQTRQAREAVQRECSQGNPGWISQIALCEFVWVLGGAYEYTRGEIVPALERILATEHLEVERSAQARDALRMYRSTKADFADCLIALSGAGGSASTTLTFDVRAAKAGIGMRLLQS